MIAPAVGRQQSEMLGPMIAREIDILARQHALPPAPAVIADAELVDRLRQPFDARAAVRGHDRPDARDGGDHAVYASSGQRLMDSFDVDAIAASWRWTPMASRSVC